MNGNKTAAGTGAGAAKPPYQTNLQAQIGTTAKNHLTGAASRIHTKNGARSIANAAISVMNGNTTSCTFTPENQPPTSAFREAGSYTDLVIRNATVSVLRDFCCTMDITNTSATGELRVGAPWNLFRLIEMKPDGSNTRNQFYPLSMREIALIRNSDEGIHEAAARQLTPPGGNFLGVNHPPVLASERVDPPPLYPASQTGPWIIPPTETRQIVVPLNFPEWSSGHYSPKRHTESEMRIRFYWNTTAAVLEENVAASAADSVEASVVTGLTALANLATIANMDVSNLRFHMQGTQYAPEHERSLDSIYNMGHVWSTLVPTRAEESGFTVDLSGGTGSIVEAFTDVRMKNFTRVVAWVTILAQRVADITNSTQATDTSQPISRAYDALRNATYTFKNAAGDPFDVQEKSATTTLFRSRHFGQYLLYFRDLQLPQSTAGILESWCERPVAAMRLGINTGGIRLGGNETFTGSVFSVNPRITEAGSAAVPVSLIMHAWGWRLVRQKAGRFEYIGE